MRRAGINICKETVCERSEWSDVEEGVEGIQMLQ